MDTSKRVYVLNVTWYTVPLGFSVASREPSVLGAGGNICGYRSNNWSGIYYDVSSSPLRLDNRRTERLPRRGNTTVDRGPHAAPPMRIFVKRLAQ